MQLGHARKEAGDYAGAEDAYRQSLRLFPDSADTHLQLGHVLKLQGLHPAAGRSLRPGAKHRSHLYAGPG